MRMRSMLLGSGAMIGVAVGLLSRPATAQADVLKAALMERSIGSLVRACAATQPYPDTTVAASRLRGWIVHGEDRIPIALACCGRPIGGSGVRVA